MIIRSAAVADAAAIAHVFVGAWRAGYRGLVDDRIIDALDVQQWTASFETGLQEGDLSAIVSVDGDQVSGFARFGAEPSLPLPMVGYLASLYVDPAAAGRGIGTALVEAALDALAEMGRTDVGLWVFTGNARARKLYERMGFDATGELSADPAWGAEQMRYRRYC